MNRSQPLLKPQNKVPGFVSVSDTHLDVYKRQEMDQTAAAFAQTCLDAKELGFDMVMLHFAHGWLPAQFLSPALNHRTDSYGGCLENRLPFPLAIIKAVREACLFYTSRTLRDKEFCIP